MCQVVETEAGREALRKELANLTRKMAELEDEMQLKEREYALALDDSRRNEKKLDEQVTDHSHAGQTSKTIEI